MKTFLIEEQLRVEQIIRSCKLCFVGMVDEDGAPYVIPMNFGYNGEVLFLHSAPEGKSIRILEQNPKVCITFCTDSELIRQHPDVACSYRMKGESVICNGLVEFEEILEKKVEALNCIMRQYSDKEFHYSDPAVKNVKIWIVKIASITAKEFGVMRPGGTSYKDRKTF